MTEPRRIYSKEEFHRKDTGKRRKTTANSRIGSRLDDYIYEPPRERESQLQEKKQRRFRRQREKTNGCAFGCGCGCALLLMILFVLGGGAYLAFSGDLDPHLLEGVRVFLKQIIEEADNFISQLFFIVEGLF